jgi:broad specificity phosphatase PhoE
LAATVDGSESGDVLVVTHGGVIRTIERSLGATPESLPNLGGRWLLADSPRELALGERVVLLEPEEVTVPRGPSEQDPVKSEDAAK